jgi:NitT/TauT family transport system substrate-binding protein
MTDSIARRALLRGGAAALTLPLVGFMPVGRYEPSLNGPICHTAVNGEIPLDPNAPLKELKVTWNANAVCTVGVPIADKKGYFAKHGLKVELINFGGSTDQLLEAIATGKADAGVGMALRWLKPLEQGFDVKIVGSTHGGCMRLFTTKSSGISTIADLKGKTVGVADLAAPDKNFFSIVAAKQGIDPATQIEWRAFPGDVLPVALKKGDVQAIAMSDPLGWIVRDREDLFEIANNLSGEYAHRVCCVVGVRGSLLRDDRPTAAALTAALMEAQEFIAANPDEAAEIYAPYSAAAKPAQLAAMLRSHTHHEHPAGDTLKQQLTAYADELKLVNVLKPSTDTAKFANKIYAAV